MEIDDKCPVPFLRLCEFLTKIQNSKGKLKTMALNEFFSRSHVSNFFPIVRLMIPACDLERGNYGLKETTLAKLYAGLLSLPAQHREALIHYKDPQKQVVGSMAGGFVEVLESLLKDRVGDSKGLTVEQVNVLLDRLAAALDKDAKKRVLGEIMKNMNAQEQVWTVRMILKDLKIGANETILKSFHAQALDIYSYTNNLRDVFCKLKDPTQLGAHLFSFGQPIKPMLADRKQYSELKNLLLNEDLIVETKYDGERIQCHWSTDSVKYFSRNAVDVTYLYAKSLNEVLAGNIEGVTACILDGELIVWDLESSRPAAFGLNKAVALEKVANKCLCYIVFDILYIERDSEKQDLMKKPLYERKDYLRLILHDVPHRLEKSLALKLRGFKAVLDEFNKATERNEEGLIVKLCESPYIPNDRSSL